MVQDNVQDATTLTFTGVSCIWRVLEAYGALPINYICRIFSQAGLIPKLFAVIKQLINLVRNATKHMPSPSSPSALSHTFTKGGSEWGLEDVGMAGPGPGSRAATITSSALKTMGSPTFKDGTVTVGRPDSACGVLCCGACRHGVLCSPGYKGGTVLVGRCPVRALGYCNVRNA